LDLHVQYSQVVEVDQNLLELKARVELVVEEPQ
jgi:hypothetical protein